MPPIDVLTGKAQADAAAECKVKVFVFSTLEDVDKRSKARAGLPCSLLCCKLLLCMVVWHRNIVA